MYITVKGDGGRPAEWHVWLSLRPDSELPVEQQSESFILASGKDRATAMQRARETLRAAIDALDVLHDGVTSFVCV